MATLAGDLMKSMFRRRSESGSGGQIVRHVSRYAVALCELLEAEGRDLRRAVMQTGAGLGLLVASTVLLVTSLVVIVRSIYLWLLEAMSAPPALLVTGIITLIIAGICGVCAKQVSRT